MTIVTDHALVRWLERAHGVDLLTFRDEICAAVRTGVEAGAISVYYGGVTYILDGDKVVTVLEGRVEPWMLKRSDGSFIRSVKPSEVGA